MIGNQTLERICESSWFGTIEASPLDEIYALNLSKAPVCPFYIAQIA